MGLCKSQQMVLDNHHTQEEVVSNEIPTADLPMQVAPFLLNVPGLLYPQENLKQEETPKQETPKQVWPPPTQTSPLIVERVIWF